jgi:hypothetical protein
MIAANSQKEALRLKRDFKPFAVRVAEPFFEIMPPVYCMVAGRDKKTGLKAAKLYEKLPESVTPPTEGKPPVPSRRFVKIKPKALVKQ